MVVLGGLQSFTMITSWSFLGKIYSVRLIWFLPCICIPFAKVYFVEKIIFQTFIAIRVETDPNCLRQYDVCLAVPQSVWHVKSWCYFEKILEMFGWNQIGQDQKLVTLEENFPSSLLVSSLETLLFVLNDTLWYHLECSCCVHRIMVRPLVYPAEIILRPLFFATVRFKPWSFHEINEFAIVLEANSRVKECDDRTNVLSW